MARLTDEDRENLVAYLDGELDESTARTLEAKLTLDSGARDEAEALRQAWSLLDYLPQAEPSTTFTHRTLEKLALRTGGLSRRAPALWPMRLAWAAGVVLALTVGFGAARLIGRPGDPPEVDEHLVSHPGAIDRVRHLEQVEDLNFLQELDHPDLFGEEPGW